MAPFQMEGKAKVKSIVPAGKYKIHDTIAVLTDEKGNDINVNMIQHWPVKFAMTNYKQKPRPFKLLETGVRTIDTFNPIVEGGTGFILVRSEQVRLSSSMPSPSRQKPISLSSQPVVSVQTRLWRSSQSSQNSLTHILAGN